MSISSHTTKRKKFQDSEPVTHVNMLYLFASTHGNILYSFVAIDLKATNFRSRIISYIRTQDSKIGSNEFPSKSYGTGIRFRNFPNV